LGSDADPRRPEHECDRAPDNGAPAASVAGAERSESNGLAAVFTPPTLATA